MNQKSKTLWMGNIDTWMTKSYLLSLLNKVNIFPIKITLKTSQGKRGCAFLEFPNQEITEEILNNFNGIKVDDLELRFNHVKTYEEKYTSQIIKFTVKKYIFNYIILFFSYSLEILIKR
jgi:hypothetical protein